MVTLQTPGNIVNFHNSANFQFIINAFPDLPFYCNQVNIPGITINPINHTPMSKKTYPIHGDMLNFSPLVINFIIDEDFVNYITLYDWMVGLCSPEGGEQYTAQKLKTNLFPIEGLYTDAMIVTLNHKFRVSKSFQFHHVMISDLSEVSFSIQSEDAIYSTCTATFNYATFDIV